jgi:hypothetical protein
MDTDEEGKDIRVICVLRGQIDSSTFLKDSAATAAL